MLATQWAKRFISAEPCQSAMSGLKVWQAGKQHVTWVSFRRWVAVTEASSCLYGAHSFPRKEKMDDSIFSLHHSLKSSRMTLFPLILKAELSIIVKNSESQSESRVACFTVYNSKILWKNSACSPPSCRCCPVKPSFPLWPLLPHCGVQAGCCALGGQVNSGRTQAPFPRSWFWAVSGSQYS